MLHRFKIKHFKELWRMVSVEEAKNQVLDKYGVMETIKVSPEHALGYALAQDIISPFSLPSFRQSAMDGYAVSLNEDYEYICKGEVAAGQKASYNLMRGEAVRIFTGAQVPDTANAVIMQEWVEAEGVHPPYNIRLSENKEIRPELNIRPIGEQLAKGDKALIKGTVLNPAAIGLLESLGLDEIEVHRKPKISLLISGNELVQRGGELKEAQIFESNSSTLKSALLNASYTDVSISFCKDTLEDTIIALTSAIENSDVVITSGGISVGDHDHLEAAFGKLQVEQCFYKVRQKPGKPLFFGTKENKSVFGLPGNPASALTCLYAYIIPHLNMRSGFNQADNLTIKLPLSKDVMVKGDRSIFFKGKIQDGTISPLGGQASSMLQSFAYSNALIYLQARATPYKAGELVDVILI
ncbi:MAG: molybdopterin molybdotransferase MoeA [Bacteroidia bacterium]